MCFFPGKIDVMEQQRFSFQLRSLQFSLAAIGILLITCLVLIVSQSILISLNPIIGLGIVASILLITLLVIRPEFALCTYILLAGPTIVFSASSSGILSRLYLGDLIFIVIVGIWFLKELSSKSKTRLGLQNKSILMPFVCLALVGLISIIASHLSPDIHVTYAFLHSDVSLTLVNAVEMFLLISLPLFILVVPGLVRTPKDARWMIGAYMVVGLPYALGTILAAPLHLYSQDVILGIQRPEIFGTSSSNLGLLNVLFACLALGQTIYAKKGTARLGFGVLTSIFTGGVVMAFGRESWIGLIIAVWIILLLRFKNPLALLLPLIILPILLLFIPGVINFFDPTKVYGADRLNIWQDTIAIWQHSPYLGVGAGNFQFFDITYGTEVAGVAHNQFLEVLAEMGVQGLVCLVVAIIMIGRVVFQRFNSARSDMGKALSLAYLGYFAALLFAAFFADPFVPSTAAGGGTAPFIFISYLWIFLGLVLSIPNWDSEAAALDNMPAQRTYRSFKQ